MNTCSALLAEDEAPQRRELLRLIRTVWPELAIVAECEDGLTAIEALHAHQPDVAFLDIRMPGVSGLEVARHAGPRTQVVFTTAYAEHAVMAFEAGAVDYLLKPFSLERLQLTIERVRKRLAEGTVPDTGKILHALQQHASPPREGAMRWISASVGATVKLIPMEEVLFFQAKDKYTRVVSSTEESIIRLSLRELLERLDPESYWQVHRSVIVRVDSIRALKRTEDGKYELVLAGTTERVPVSAAFKDRFKAM